jgi:hypothetical protein
MVLKKLFRQNLGFLVTAGCLTKNRISSSYSLDVGLLPLALSGAPLLGSGIIYATGSSDG